MTVSLTVYQLTTIYWRKLLEFLHFPLINLHMLERVGTWLTIFSLQLKATPEYLKELMMSFLDHVYILRNKTIPEQPLSVQPI